MAHPGIGNPPRTAVVAAATAVALSDDRRAAIAAFLRARRDRLRPEQVGLPRGSRRRTPGLRREEVAALARLSPEWYRWLEQARNVRASEQALLRIAGALRLEPGEVRHLLTLSGYGVDGIASGALQAETISPYLQRLVDELGCSPAWVLGHRWDVLAWNRAATVIFGDLAAMTSVERNALYQMFLTPRFRSMLHDWEMHARDMVAKIRLIHARHADDPWFNEVIRLLHTRSKEFAAWWDDHLVQLPRDGTKYYDHPDAGRLSFDYTVLDVSDERLAALHLVLYLPSPGSGTREKMESLLRSPRRSPPTRPRARAGPPRERRKTAQVTRKSPSRASRGVTGVATSLNKRWLADGST